jgi:hypothetical protein
MRFDELVDGKTNAELAKAVDYIASCMRGGISDAILKEAAKRLRGEPEPQFAMPPSRGLPPLKAYAVPDADAKSWVRSA